MEISHRNLTQQLVHELGKAILQGKYSDNKLPSEADLSKEYDISRTATREAIKMLTAKGLISSRPRQGIKVQDIQHWNLFDSDVLRWVLLGKPDLYMLRHFLDVRLAIEPAAASLAARYASDDEIIKIEHSLSKLKFEGSGYDDTHQADIDFHKSILFASNNPFFIQLQTFVETALKVNLHFTKRADAVSEKEYQEHVDIFNCIKAGDEQGAFASAAKTTKLTISLVNEKIAELESQ